MTVARALVPSPNIAQLKESATIAVSARAKALRAAGRRVIDLGAGEPDFDTPEFIRRAAQRAIDAGATRYTATEGILPLREAIATFANADYRGDDRVTPGDIVVSTGSKQSLFNACFVLFGPGDEVLIPTPSWTSYYEMVALARAEPVPVLGDPANGLKVNADALAAAATPATKGVMLNSPCNPTGAVYDRAELEAILSLAEARGWWVISDEIYRRIAYAGVATSIFEVASSRDRVILIDGVAKAYAMTGWRIGWAIAPRAVARAMGALQSHTTSNAAAVSQHAALAALTDRAAAEASIAHMVGEFERRRDAALAMLAGEPGIGVIPPDGAFYLFLDVSGTRGDSRAGAGGAFAQHLLERHDVAVVPGAAFYTPDWVRLSYAAPLDHVVTGVQRTVSAFREMKS
ncbi:MAG TPA: pyridoxal phosphate-dependent aminotransferase [Gemmatimonadaceae bacterium]|nr:pyridoxal phosphate-dependent aminotransferase [Gemmatimonadaceae bacterium]